MSAQPLPLRRLQIAGVLLFTALASLLLWIGWRPAPMAPLAVAIGPWIGYDPWVLVREQQRLPQSLRMIELPSATDTLNALRDGRIGAAGVTLDEALRLRAQLPDLRVIGVLSDSRGADGILLRQGLDPAAGLSGRRVLVEDGAVGGLLLAAALEREGLDTSAVTAIATRAMHLELRWRQGVGDAVVCYEPLLSRLLAEGHTLLHSTRELPGLIYDVVVARTAVLETRPADIEALLAAWEEGVLQFERPEQIDLQQITPGTGLEPSEYARALGGIRFFRREEGEALLSQSDSHLRAMLPDIQRQLEQRGELAAGLELEGFLHVAGRGAP